MADKYPVSIYGRPNGFIRAEEGATAGATLGVDLRDEVGDLVLPASVDAEAAVDAHKAETDPHPTKANLTGATFTGSVTSTSVVPFVMGTAGGISLIGAGALAFYAEAKTLYFRPTSRLSTTGQMYITTTGIVTISSNIRPSVDNVSSNGEASNRWSTVYAGTGTINTSDAREKFVRGSLTTQELAAAQELASAAVIYQWNAAVAEKGVEARLHCGPTVQSVISIMQSHGLDPFRYGFVCYDVWDELPEIVTSWPDEFGEDGELIRAAGSEVTQEYRPSGDLYSLRPSELESFIAAGMAQKIASLEARLAALEV